MNLHHVTVQLWRQHCIYSIVCRTFLWCLLGPACGVYWDPLVVFSGTGLWCLVGPACVYWHWFVRLIGTRLWCLFGPACGIYWDRLLGLIETRLWCLLKPACGAYLDRLVALIGTRLWCLLGLACGAYWDPLVVFIGTGLWHLLGPACGVYSHSMWETSPTPARPLPCLHRLQEGIRQGLACSFVGNNEEVQHQHKPYPCHQEPL